MVDLSKKKRTAAIKRRWLYYIYDSLNVNEKTYTIKMVTNYYILTNIIRIQIFHSFGMRSENEKEENRKNEDF